MVVLEKNDFERLAKENIELREALKAIGAGELALRKGKTRGLRSFLNSASRQNGENN